MNYKILILATCISSFIFSADDEDKSKKDYKIPFVAYSPHNNFMAGGHPDNPEKIKVHDLKSGKITEVDKNPPPVESVIMVGDNIVSTNPLTGIGKVYNSKTDELQDEFQSNYERYNPEFLKKVLNSELDRKDKTIFIEEWTNARTPGRRIDAVRALKRQLQNDIKDPKVLKESLLALTQFLAKEENVKLIGIMNYLELIKYLG